jgi:hypothetical protein
MSAKEIREFLKESLLGEDAPPLTDADVNALLLLPVKTSPASVKRMRKLYVAKAFDSVYPEPVRSVYGSTFGSWIKAARKRPNLVPESVAIVIGKEADFVEDLEAENVAPWDLPPRMMADIVTLFHIHIDALAELLSSSYAAARRRQSKVHYPLPHELAGGLHTTATIDLGDRSSTSQAEAEPQPKIELNDKSVRLLKKVRQILERRGAVHLLN